MKTRTILFADKVLFGKELQERSNQCIIIEKGKIAKVIDQTALPKRMMEEVVIELPKGFVLMPGMIDFHTHLALDARIPGHLGMMEDTECEQTLRALKSLHDDLLAGITSLRCMGDRYYIDVILRDLINKNEIAGPRMQVAGIGMKALHGHGYVGQAFSGAEEFRRQSRLNLSRNVDWLKIFITPGDPPINDAHIDCYLTREEVASVVHEAKACGKKTSAHCIGGEGLRLCAEEGVDVLDHAYWATESDVDLILKKQITICLTPGVFLDEGREPFCPALHVQNVQKTRDEVRNRLSMLVEAGVPYAIGSDAYHGFLYKDVKYICDLGAATLDAIKGVTSRAAKMLSMEGKIGTIQEGAFADIIAVNGNPLDNIDVLSNVVFVMKDGEVIKEA